VREVAIDEHASNFTAAILKNLGIIGLIVSPKVRRRASARRRSARSRRRGEGVHPARIHRRQARRGAGARRADEAQLLQYNMQGFDVGPIRDVSEERVCAAIGIPAAVVGFGTGLQQTKVGATMKEMRQLAWISGVIPLQRIVANEIRRSLLPEFIPEASRGSTSDQVRFCRGAAAVGDAEREAHAHPRRLQGADDHAQ
jgi:hypothetical protein